MSVYDELITDRTLGDLMVLQSIYNKPRENWTAEDIALMQTDLKAALNASDVNRLARVANFIGLTWIWEGSAATDLKATYTDSDICSEGGDMHGALATALAHISAQFMGGDIHHSLFDNLDWQKLNATEMELKTIIQHYYHWLIPEGGPLYSEDAGTLATEDNIDIRVED